MQLQHITLSCVRKDNQDASVTACMRQLHPPSGTIFHRFWGFILFVSLCWHRSYMQAHPASVHVMMMSQAAHDRAVPTPLYAEGKLVLDLK